MSDNEAYMSYSLNPVKGVLSGIIQGSSIGRDIGV